MGLLEAFSISFDPDFPVATAAVHDGHALRPEVRGRIAMSEAERLREEDPFTARWTAIAGTRFVGRRSRFEVDLNRPRNGAVYRTPGEAWGIDVWRTPLDDELVERSLRIHDAFYALAERTLSELASRWGRFVVLDLHSYNHRRDGADVAPAPEQENPEVNVGTGTLDRALWGPLVDRFMTDLRRAPGQDGSVDNMDVRENVKFLGGYFSEWVNRTFAGSGCAIAVEFKKVFMDEWSGRPDEHAIARISHALAGTLPGMAAELRRL